MVRKKKTNKWVLIVSGIIGFIAIWYILFLLPIKPNFEIGERINILNKDGNLYKPSIDFDFSNCVVTYTEDMRGVLSLVWINSGSVGFECISGTTGSLPPRRIEKYE